MMRQSPSQSGETVFVVDDPALKMFYRPVGDKAGWVP